MHRSTDVADTMTTFVSLHCVLVLLAGTILFAVSTTTL